MPVDESLARALFTHHDTLFQVSTINALLEGVYEGDTTFGELREYGDFGIGTFNCPGIISTSSRPTEKLVGTYSIAGPSPWRLRSTIRRSSTWNSPPGVIFSTQIWLAIEKKK